MARVACTLCQPLAADEVWSGNLWRVIVSRDQSALGACSLALKRHDEDVANLSDDEVRDLWATIRNVREALLSQFQPDDFSYAFATGRDTHVHLHVTPRYAGPRAFAGMTFAEADASAARPVSEDTFQEVASALREAFAGNYI